MKALIVEDERMAQTQLVRLLNVGFPDIEVVRITDSVSATVDYLSPGPDIDIIFMDVELSDGDCFEIFRQIKVKAYVVMTTAYDSYAIKAFEAGSVDYLLKPIGAESLQRAVGRCRKRSGSLDVEKLLSTLGEQLKQYKQRSVVHIGDKIIPINVEDVAFFFSEDKANYLTLCNGDKFLIDSTIDNLEEELDPDFFFRVSRGCIVARKSIVSVVRHINGRLKVICKPDPHFEMTVARARVDDFYSWLE